MESWVYIFSKFTPEALLFEGLIICVLCSGYAAFWVLKKRRLGVAQAGVPASVVKTYLTALINDAEQMRAQLFGLLKSAGVILPPGMMNQALQTATLAASTAQQTAGLTDPALANKVTTLEAQMTEQTKAMQALLLEKQKIQAELSAAKAIGKDAPAGAADAIVADLRNKIQILQSKLDEYSVIEDDLANLKRLQQENAQLKAALGGAPVPKPAFAAPAAEIPVVAAESPEAPIADAATDPMAALADLAAIPEASAPEEAAAAPAENFEGLVDKVEQSLETPVAEVSPAPEPAVEEPTASAPAELAAEPAAAAAEAPQQMGASDADLVAEFEKMLNA